MSSSNSSEAPNKTPEKKRRYLSAEKKFQIYLEAQDGGKPVGELLRREGLFSTDLARIGSRSRRGRSNASAPSPVASRARSAPKPMILTCNQ
jgi:transposase-like protein